VIRVLIKLSLLFILVYVGVTLGYGQLEKRLLVSSVVLPEEAVTSATTDEATPVLQKNSNYQIIVGRNIFEAVPEQKKVQPRKKEPVKVVEKEPEETRLKLVLYGTVSGSEHDSRAIIVDQKEKRQDLYQVGDAVQGALIVSIERGKVVLELNGKKQLLLLKDREGGGPGGGGSFPSANRSFSQPGKSKSTFVMKSSRTAFSKKSTKSPPTAVPHRRISFRQHNDEEQDLGEEENVEPGDHEEPEEPLVEEDLEMELDSLEGADPGE
jgi:type II secretory pathway component PulC